MSSSTNASSKLSFTIRRPTPVSRNGSSGPNSDAESSFKIPALPRRLDERSSSTGSPLASGNQSPRRRRRYDDSDDSSNEEERDVDEIVTGFDEFGVQRLKHKKPEGPLVIPALQDRDWREVARKRKAVFVPGGGQAATGADGSVGGLGTRDSINSGPQIAGLIKPAKKLKTAEDADGILEDAAKDAKLQAEIPDETEDAKARRAILASLQGEAEDEPMIDAIPVIGNNNWSRVETETDAYRRDMLSRPNSASLSDYDRIPVAEFGAALLRGMGWKPGQAASRKRVGPVEPYLPTARPALLGIGAKERVLDDDGSSIGKKVQNGTKKPERRYIPVIKREKSPRREASSRKSSRSPEPERKRGDRERDRDRDRDHDSRGRRDYASDGDKDRERRRERERDRNRSRNGEYAVDKDRDVARSRDRNGYR